MVHFQGQWYNLQLEKLIIGTHVAIFSLWSYERPDKAWYWTRVWEWKNNTCNVLDGISEEGQVVSQEPLCITHTDTFFAEKDGLYIIMVDGQLGIRNKDFSMIIVEFPEKCDTENRALISEQVNTMLAETNSPEVACEEVRE